jgi:hypothetical protein
MTRTFTPRCRRPRTRADPPLALLAGALLALAIRAPAASAKTVTLHLFSRETSSTFADAQGHPVPPNTRRQSAIRPTTPRSITSATTSITPPSPTAQTTCAARSRASLARVRRRSAAVRRNRRLDAPCQRRDVHAVGQPSPGPNQRRYRNLPARARAAHPDQHRSQHRFHDPGPATDAHDQWAASERPPGHGSHPTPPWEEQQRLPRAMEQHQMPPGPIRPALAANAP